MRRFDWSSIVTAAPVVFIVFVCSAMPLTWMAASVLANPQVRAEFSLNSFRLELLARTIGYNGAAAVIATAMGLPAGIVLGRGRGIVAKVLWVLLPAALIMPSLSYAYGWAQLVRIIRPVLSPWGILFKPNGPADVLRCIWSLAAWLWAVPAGLIGIALRRLDTSVQQQAVLDGALRRVTIRQLAGPIIASAAIVTIIASQEFAVYEPTGISVVATEVRMVFDTGAMSTANMPITVSGYLGAGMKSTDQPQRAAAAIATAAPMLLITVFLAIAAGWGASRSSASETLAVGDWPRTLDASRFTVGLTILLMLWNIGVPVAALIGSLRNAQALPNIWIEFWPQLRGSMILAGDVALIAMIASLSASGKWLKGLLAIAGASFLVGGQLLAIGLIRIFNRPGLDWAYDCWVVPAIAYLGRFGWLAVAAARGTWSQPWQDLRDMSAVDGANTSQMAWSVIWPLAWPALLGGGLVVGALSLTEVPATVLLMPQHPQVLTPMLMTWVHMARFDPMIEASLLMMAVVLLPALAGVLLTVAGSRVLRATGARAGEYRWANRR